MNGWDTELNRLRYGIDCAAVLEKAAPPWRLDRRESTRRALKYRRGEGEVLIVNHDGRGWWDPLSSAKGDVFDLVRFLDPNLTFGQGRRMLRRFVGVTSTYPDISEPTAKARPDRSLAERWRARPRLRRASAAWCYLTAARGLPASVLQAADEVDVVREGPHGSAWFAHRCGQGVVCHIDIRGPAFKGSLRGGHKTLFVLRPAAMQPHLRLILAEAPIDALSLAAIESIREDTAYLATGGGMGSGTIVAIEDMLTSIASVEGCSLVSASDANVAGDRYATRHAEMAAMAGVSFVRLRPTVGSDWNDVLRLTRTEITASIKR